MNGKEKYLKQISSGTREHVEVIDQLRLKHGFARVMTLTPIVETKLRSGFIPQRPMQLSIKLNDDCPLFVIISIPIRYPNDFYDISLKCGDENNSEWLAFTEIMNEQISILVRDNISAINGTNLVIEALQVAARPIIDQLTSTSSHLVASSISPSALEITVEDDQEESLTTAGGVLIDLETKNQEVVTAEADQPEPQNSDPYYYSCRVCSHRLFTYSQRKLCVNSDFCTSYFLEDSLPWITEQQEEQQRLAANETNNFLQEGKIYCSKCKARLGTWTWVGSKCSCGKWNAPAYQFTRSKLDEKVVL
jgi:hypothetical protein